MEQQQQEWQEEISHFGRSREIIRENIQAYEEEYERRRKEALDLFRAMQTGDVELYDRMATAQSLAEHSANQLRKNRAAWEKPYFGRIDFTDRELDRKERIYIGKNGVFRHKTEMVVADWRAPVSSVYYENELGRGSYPLPEIKGKEPAAVEIDLHLKRTYDVAAGHLQGYYDSDVAANDELLVKYLSKQKDVVLGEIIATIQKEQNEIIRESPFANQLVQGVAGSGKTTVAMHRMSYILYNYKERFRSNEFCVVGSNDLLLNYITGGLPELEVSNVKKMRMDALFTHLLKKEWRLRYQVTVPFADAGERCGIGFYRQLEVFLRQKKQAYVALEKLVDREIGLLLTENNNRSLFEEHEEFSAFRLLTQMDDRILSRIKSLTGQFEKELLAKKQKQYGRHYRKRFPKVTVVELYREFLENWHLTNAADRPTGGKRAEEGRDGQTEGSTGNRAEDIAYREKKSLVIPHADFFVDNIAYREKKRLHDKITNLHEAQAHLAAMKKGNFDIYDVAALVLIDYRIFQKAPDEEFGQLFIDEAQDYGSGLYFVLKTVLPACYFTVMGDVSQNINYETGMNDWEELREFFLAGKKDKFRLLSKSYRNTIEISQYAGKILAKASAGRYQITPVIRHGIPVAEETFWSSDEMAECAGQLILSLRERQHQTIAVICRDEREAARAGKLLREILPLELEKLLREILPFEQGKLPRENHPLKLEKSLRKPDLPSPGMASGEANGQKSSAESSIEGSFQQGIMILPVRMTKGLEFDAVILWNPLPVAQLSDPGTAKLLYVAATRALHELYVLRY